MLLLASLLVLAPPVDLIDPWQRRGEAPSEATPEATTSARGDLVDPWSVPPREPPPSARTSDLVDPWSVPPREPPPSARTSDLVDPWSVPPREPSRSAPASDLVDPWSGAPRATPGEGHASRRVQLKDPYAERPRRRAPGRGDDLHNPFAPRK